ncbi:potassium channel family protein [Lentilactobacillus hilgardii]|uniref:potassium channel family protein n=1 Tax=Lentilactobacillus hilgardii TaxID=1588 RepID=UPI0039EA6199
MKKYNIAYNMTIMILAIVSIALTILDFCNIISLNSDPWNVINDGILIIFTIDYFTRLAYAKDKSEFFIHNIFDLLAIIPLYSAFSFFRFSRVFRIFRLLKLLRFIRMVGVIGKLQKSFHTFLKTNGFIYLLWISLATLFISASMYALAEHVSWGQALWWAIATATTVGYGDISPHTLMGRIAAVLLMFVGIGFIGMLTSTITSFFAGQDKSQYRDLKVRLTKIEQQNEELKNSLDDLKKKIK